MNTKIFEKANQVIKEYPSVPAVNEKQVMKFPSFDGYPLEGKLTLPKGYDEVSKLVVFVQGTGPNTYENRDVVEGTEVYCFETLST